MGGSIFVHTFGAFFGIAVTSVVTPKCLKDKEFKHEKCEGSYES